ncbi:fimbrial biogenesis chaperone [Yokenella regensburgei]|jgi:P pilus assembly chaperone PapD|uniref:fimbrial biogenesis chaperone n=1 Tax=Yokenella regensburgei TaxID=158877 RepID=UPI0027D98240|nr:fimbria/pilus periplasmic chaperone [Yokenella regensburgei]MDQ4428491.1 molecular chaperone [Yokenella regensburgei]
MKFFTGVMVGALLITSAFSQAKAGVIIGGTRVVYTGDKKETSLSITNPDALPYLIQSWVEASAPGGSKPPFIITPPLYRLDKGQQNMMRIVLVGRLSQEKESLFWLNIKSIPSVTPRDNTLQVAVKTRIKLIYRPQALAGSGPEEQAGKLIWSRNGAHVQVHNPTPYYINFNEIKVGGIKLEEATYVAPGSTAMFTLPTGNTSSQLAFKIINDYGGIGEVHAARL